MSRPQFLADNDLDQHIVDGVMRREPTIEFIRLRDEDMQEYSDPDVLAYAATNGFIVVSDDMNTMVGHARERLAAGQPMPGLFVIRQNQPIATAIESLIMVWAATEAEEWNGLIQFLPL